MDREINGVVGDTANAIQYIGDNLIGISNALSIDNVKGIQEMVSAIDDAGAVVNSAGGSMEWYMGCHRHISRDNECYWFRSWCGASHDLSAHFATKTSIHGIK